VQACAAALKDRAAAVCGPLGDPFPAPRHPQLPALSSRRQLNRLHLARRALYCVPPCRPSCAPFSPSPRASPSPCLAQPRLPLSAPRAAARAPSCGARGARSHTGGPQRRAPPRPRCSLPPPSPPRGSRPALAPRRLPPLRPALIPHLQSPRAPPRPAPRRPAPPRPTPPCPAPPRCPPAGCFYASTTRSLARS
jgi:hypothetical protein